MEIFGIPLQAFLGQLLLGLGRPCADLSRGATEDSILGVAAIVGLTALENRKPNTQAST